MERDLESLFPSLDTFDLPHLNGLEKEYNVDFLINLW